MGIKTVEELLFHFPRRYEDFSHIKKISQIKSNEQICIAGRILQIKTSKTWKKKMFVTEALVEDESGAVRAVWFNQPYLTNVLKQGDNVCLAGKATTDKQGLYLSSPAYEKFSIAEINSLTHTGRLVPVYPETEGLSSRWLRLIIKRLLTACENSIAETLPQEIIKKHNFLPLKEALRQVHFPDSLIMAEEAQRRFAFEELFFLELFVVRQRLRLNKEKAPAVPINAKLIKKFVQKLPFKLTDAQRKCAWQILKDMERPRPMARLLQGDVGSGKTLVALIAALNAAKAGWQTAFMAPTEILAKQHFQQTIKLLQPFKVKIGLLTGKQDKISAQKLRNEILEISRRKLLEKARCGEIDILIGTHALIQKSVKFQKLALCIVDEQHRFGIEQRASLIQKDKTSQKRLIPHLLSMTATPIPRSLALTIYGDLDLSLLDEMPQGRKRIITKIIPPAERDAAYEFIRQRVEAGEQAFVICPRIEKKEATEQKRNSWNNVKAVKQEYEKLTREIFPSLKIEMLHGKMKTREKEKIMKEFRRKKCQILVATSVVEVGIDIPHATIIVIEGAERFGLAQLHQLRGRVGRSQLQSYCLLFTDSPAKKTWQRLKAMIQAEDGFELSQKDLAIRGPGSLLGSKQWGLPDAAMANLSDLPLVEKAREAAKEILQQDPELKAYSVLKNKLKRFENRTHLE